MHEIYVTDVNEEGDIEYWLLHKALYELKQSRHKWYNMLSKILEHIGYNQGIGDETCFTAIKR